MPRHRNRFEHTNAGDSYARRITVATVGMVSAAALVTAGVLTAVSDDAERPLVTVDSEQRSTECRVGPGPVGHVIVAPDGFGGAYSYCEQLLPDGSGRTYQ
ncbi:hypothetical protein [Gordonia sp. 'Campus']|uniref:hypothetical protein n=1 Tax=Gordonia sp. 'Campus' TaxID=2915824 RepID=UPI001EE49CDF|nr:hypothetical protein [Gordonia sp. 'Campus']